MQQIAAAIVLRADQLLAKVSLLTTWGRLLLSLVAGALLSFAFAPYQILTTAFLGFFLFLSLLISSQNIKKAAQIGWGFGFGHFLTSLYWIGESFFKQDVVPHFIAPIAVTLLAAILALYWALLAATFHRLKSGGFMGVGMFASLWFVMEWLRSILFTGFPWNPLGGISLDYGLAQWASIIGVEGLNYVMAFFLAWPLLLYSKGKYRLLKPIFLFTVMIVCNYLGLWVLLPDHIAGGAVTVRLVQANIAQEDKWDPEKREQAFEDYITLSKQAEGFSEVDVLVWPETALTFPIDRQVNRREYLMQGLEGKPLISGAPRYVRDDQTGLAAFNSIQTIAGDGQIRATYDKAHLVPFGEYLPFRGLLSVIGMQKLTAGSIDFSTGPGPQTIITDLLPAFSPLVCYEVIFPHAVVNDQISVRPKWLVNLTNDAWFGSSIGPWQHMAMARFRSIEQRLPMVRVAGTGISGYINRRGELQQWLDIGVRGTLDIKLPIMDEKDQQISAYGKHQTNIVIFFLVISLISLLIIVQVQNVKVQFTSEHY